MKVVFFFLALFAVALAADGNDCNGRVDGYFCEDLFNYVLCESDSETGPTECADNKICVEGTTSYFYGNMTINPATSEAWYKTFEPACQDAVCDTIAGAVLSEWADTIMYHCADVVYDRDTYYGLHKLIMDDMAGGGDGEYPEKIERDSRRDPEDHDHQTKTCDMPAWCEECCGGAEQQENYLITKYNVTTDDECNVRTHVMTCAKKFPSCEWGSENSNYAKEMCMNWRSMCIKDLATRSDFDCDLWLSSGFSVIPSIVLAVFALFF